MNTSDIEWVTVKTTRPVFPYPSNAQRRAILTERLILRPFQDDQHDLEGLHAIRASPEVMKWSIQAVPDKDLEETRTGNLALQVPPNDAQRFNWAICLASTGQVIGIGGSSNLEGSQGWPEIGYMLCPDAWGRGYASEFLGAFLEAWWALPREEVDLRVDKRTVRGGGEVKDEAVTATADYDNGASHGVLRKAGFALATAWVEDDLRDLARKIELHGFVAYKDSKGKR